MCCFSGNINRVSETKIFARLDKDIQYLAYEMSLDTSDDVAMILPIPIQKGKKAHFIDLSGSPDLFKKIEELFPTLGYKGDSFYGSRLGSMRSIKVEKVGSFDASFVPSVGDMDRLDKRFSIPKDIWDALPEYADFGFVVFKLSAGNDKRHPMSFSFKSASDKIFYPTVHVHDGSLPEVEEFDHTLYCQTTKKNRKDKDRRVRQWRAGEPITADLVKSGNGLFDNTGKIYKAGIHGSQENRDTYVDFV